MDVVGSVRECLKSWTKGGEGECRNILTAPHCNPSDPNCLDVLSTAYNTLLCSTLSTWSQPVLNPTIFAEFVQSVLARLPSSSQTHPQETSPAAIFGDHLVDMIWAVDTQLDELLNEARVASSASQEQGKKEIAALLVAKAKRAQTNAENDKQRIPVIVKKLLELRIISPEHCRERLEPAALASVGLIQDRTAFEKKEIRTRTGLFYKQNKFNLLREQSEGYSKLVIELTSNLGPAHSSQTGLPTEPYAVIEERARPVWEKVISLIGYFDLDPNRALDVIIDVLSQHLTMHYTFFLALLSFSPWRGLYRPPLPENEAMGTKVDIPAGAYNGKSLDEVLTIAEESAQSATALPSGGSGGARVLAQVLGFKFSHYQAGSEPAPRSLYLTAAILIREGFITLEDLYPHLDPNDDDMNKDHAEYKKTIKDRGKAGKSNPLSSAAPLESSDSFTPQPKLTTATEIKIETKKPDLKALNQKAGLLKSLLAIGAIKPAIAVMSKYDWIAQAHTEIADLVLRLASVSLSSLYDTVGAQKESSASFTRPKARYSAAGPIYPVAKPMLTLWAPTPPSTLATDFVFFFPNWADRVPICTTLDDLQGVLEPLIAFIGVLISRDPAFMTKFLRLGRNHIAEKITINTGSKSDPENPTRQFWFRILRQYMLPAISLVQGNTVCTMEIWSVLRLFETSSRWMLYGEWQAKLASEKSHPELQVRFRQALKESRSILSRLAHDTLNGLTGSIAKLAHSTPTIFFSTAINQLMSYDNLATVFLQALRYCTIMDFDVLLFFIISTFGNTDRPRLKDDGVNTSNWVLHLSLLTGLLFRKYSADLTPFLKYIVNQMYQGNTSEIYVFRELMSTLAGIEPMPDLTEAQLAAMAGGPALRIEVISSQTRGARSDPSDFSKGPSRLGKTLIDSQLALPLLIQICQQRQACVFKSSHTHTKSLAALFDSTHGVLMQYLELLNTPGIISSTDYANKILPPLVVLGRDYGISVPICMNIIRPILNASLLKAALAMAEQEQREIGEEAEKRLKTQLIAKKESSTTASRVASPSLGNPAPTETTDSQQLTANEAEASMEVDSASPTAKMIESPWLPEMEALFEDLKTIAPPNACDIIGPGFYATFWQLSTYDLSPPFSKYKEEVNKLKTLSQAEDAQYTQAERASRRTTAITHKSRRDRFNSFITTLSNELKDQVASRSFTIKRLTREKHHWFAHSTVKNSVLMDAIFQHCIQPRCLLSPMDADFCAQFIKTLHLLGTPGFHTLGCYNRILDKHVEAVLFSCSGYEARNYGRFLCNILRDLVKWYQDEQLYKKENKTKVDGKDMYFPSMTLQFSTTQLQSEAKHIDWVQLQTIVRKFYRKMAFAFLQCLQSKEFMHVYNAIVVLKEILEVFPLAEINPSGNSINAAIGMILKTEKRSDLKVLAQSYAASLRKKESQWVVPAKPSQEAPGPSTTRTGTNTPIPDRPRSSVPTGPSSQLMPSADRRSAAPPSSTPSAPRAQIASSNSSSTQNEKSANSTISSAKLAMDSIPRPEVVKRVRPDSKAAESPKPPADSTLLKPEPMQVDRRPSPVHSSGIVVRENGPSSLRPDSSDPMAGRHPTKDAQSLPQANGLNPKDHAYRPSEQPPLRADASPGMPPPAAPSQTASAQELRETARQTIGKTERPESRTQPSSAAPSPQVRSTSPTSRPGTRNPSIESRASGGKSRSDSDKPDRGPEDSRSDRDSRAEPRFGGRRDSLTHTRSERGSGRDRSNRESEKDRDGDRDKDRGRDRHSEKDRDSARDRDRDRERDRERDRDRDRDRDRHRRDDKDRDRDSRKDRDTLSRGQASAPEVPPDDHSLPARADAGSRHRNPGPSTDDGLGKRRRPADDDVSAIPGSPPRKQLMDNFQPDRGSKRASRKDSHREDRSRRTADDKDRNRDSDRRRKDREPADNEGRGSSAEKALGADKRALEPSKNLPANTPSGPRSMAPGAESSRGKPEPSGSGRDRRKPDPTPAGRNPGPSRTPIQEDPALPSLQARLGLSEMSEAPISFIRADSMSRKEDERDYRKRTASDRDHEMQDAGNTTPKRPRTQGSSGAGSRQRGHRNEMNNNFAKRTLPIDPSASERNPRR